MRQKKIPAFEGLYLLDIYAKKYRHHGGIFI